MSAFSYHLSVPIDDKRRLAQIEKEALKHNRKGMSAPFVRDLIYDFLDGKFVRIASSTQNGAVSKRRIE